MFILLCHLYLCEGCLLINRLHPSSSSPFYQLIHPALASLISSPCNLDGLQCTCLCALSVLSCFCTDHSGLLSCKLFCFGCCRRACSACSPGRAFTVAGQSVHSSCVHQPPLSSQAFFQSSSFFQTFHPNSQFIIAISPAFLRVLRSHVLPRSSPFYPEAPPWNFIRSSLNLHLSPLRPWPSSLLALEFHLPQWFLLKYGELSTTWANPKFSPTLLSFCLSSCYPFRVKLFWRVVHTSCRQYALSFLLPPP